MRFKTKTKEFQMMVRVRFSSSDEINSDELEFFEKKALRGFMKPKRIKSNVINYTGPVGISLYDRLKSQISKYDFFFIIEQVVSATQKLQANSLFLTRLSYDLKTVFFNETTKELQFIYLPVVSRESNTDVMEFIESIIYSAQPLRETDMNYISRFVYFLKSLPRYSPEKIERYIMKEERGVVDTIKKHNASESGFMTDKPKDYYDHYAQKGSQHSEYGRSHGVEYDPGDEPTGLLIEDDPTGILLDDDATDLLCDDEATGLLIEDEEGTALLAEEPVHCPTVRRLSTDEVVAIDKPVFRIGKERSYVDYFVANNNAVSRSHADIITRDGRYYIVDLNSKNRTYRNNVPLPIQIETELFDGDRIRLANEEFIFNI